MKKLIVGTNESGQRLDKYLGKTLSEAPKSFIYKMLRKKNITLNDKKADGSEKLNVGDTVTFWLSDETFDKFKGVVENMSAKRLPKPEIIYEDNQIIIMNKAPGVLSQKAAPEDVSINEMMIGWLLESGQLTKEMLQTFHPSVCNRLDRNTSGILIAGKSLPAARHWQLCSSCQRAFVIVPFINTISVLSQGKLLRRSDFMDICTKMRLPIR